MVAVYFPFFRQRSRGSHTLATSIHRDSKLADSVETRSPLYQSDDLIIAKHHIPSEDWEQNSCSNEPNHDETETGWKVPREGVTNNTYRISTPRPASRLRPRRKMRGKSRRTRAQSPGRSSYVRRPRLDLRQKRCQIRAPDNAANLSVLVLGSIEPDFLPAILQH